MGGCGRTGVRPRCQAPWAHRTPVEGALGRSSPAPLLCLPSSTSAPPRPPARLKAQGLGWRQGSTTSSLTPLPLLPRLLLPQPPAAPTPCTPRPVHRPHRAHVAPPPTRTRSYILRMERIPHPASRDAVFFMHGVLDTSMAWVSAGAAPAPSGCHAAAACPRCPRGRRQAALPSWAEAGRRQVLVHSLAALPPLIHGMPRLHAHAAPGGFCLRSLPQPGRVGTLDHVLITAALPYPALPLEQA